MTVEDALMAVEAGADAIVVSNHGGRVLDFTPGSADVLPEIAKAVKGKIKILVVVSNHGGRVLDFTPGSADVLPEIAKAVKGKIKILVDGGVRTGVDVVKMLGLGADAVLIGRPFVTASFGGATDGVETYVNKIKSEIVRTGVDVVKMLGLGADAVLIGRPFVTASFGGATDGVETYVNKIKSEIKGAMILTGCSNISEIDEKVIYR